jgi:hypothetical protein
VVNVGGGTCRKETETPLTMLVIDRATTTLFVESLVDLAVMVTVLPAGTAAGAVYVVERPLAVWAGLNEPQLVVPGAGVQLTAQSTPRFAGSLVTLATSGPEALTCNGGGSCVMETEMGGARIVTTAVAAKLLFAVGRAVMLTLLPAGTTVGAV